MSRSVTAAAPAKINLQLGVGPVRRDGFHTLATIYQAVDLYDEVTVASSASTTLTVTGDGVDLVDVPEDASNLALRAAQALADRAGVAGTVAMRIRKRIPVAGGMAGGSADAAAALVACDALWDLGTPRAELLALAAELGSDVPFCLVGGTATGSGRGEVVEPLNDVGSYTWVVALPGGGLSTPGVYRELDRLRGQSPVPDPEISEDLVAALRQGDAAGLAGLLANDLQPAALGLRPGLTELLERGLSASASAALLSGSGPTCLFLTRDETHARQVGDALARSGTATLVTRGPVPGAHLLHAL